MASPIVTTAALIQCPHGGLVSVVSTSVRVRAAGQPLALADDTFPVAGCPFLLPPPVPNPCVLARWVVPAARVRVLGRPVVLQTSTGLGVDAKQVPQGPVRVVVTQPRVRGL
jgi:hypothetical protein